MDASSNGTRNHCTICLEGLVVRTTVTLRCRHTFHLDCLGSAFNAAEAMRCPVCRAVEEGVWRTFPTRAPRSGRAGASVAQGDGQVPPVQMQSPSGLYWSLDQGWFSRSLSHGNGGPLRHPYLSQHRHGEPAHMTMGSVDFSSDHASASSHLRRVTHLRLGVNRRPNMGYSFQSNVGSDGRYHPYAQGMSSIQPVEHGEPNVAFSGEPIFQSRPSGGSSLGRLAGAAPVERSMNLPSPPVRTMMRAANNRSNSIGPLPAEQTAFQAEGSGRVNIELPEVELVLALSADLQPGDEIEGTVDIISDSEGSVEDLL